jgi:dihydrofolate reductase
MSKLIADISMSLDGYVAGPDPSMKDPLGVGGEELHEWAINSEAWRESHGREGGEGGADSDLLRELHQGNGATIMGRKMFSGGSGPWDADENSNGWWGEEPPYGHPVFVLTHHEREPLHLGATTFTFVTDGPTSALEQAREAAGDKNVLVAGGAEAIQQYLAAGVVDQLGLHIAPLLLGGGARLFDGSAADAAGKLERTRMLESPTGVAHVFYKPVS